jgi:hypothetical protein
MCVVLRHSVSMVVVALSCCAELMRVVMMLIKLVMSLQRAAQHSRAQQGR